MCCTCANVFNDRSHTCPDLLTCSHNLFSASTGSRWYCNCQTHPQKQNREKIIICAKNIYEHKVWFGRTTCFGLILLARMVCQFQGSINAVLCRVHEGPDTCWAVPWDPHTCPFLNYTIIHLIQTIRPPAVCVNKWYRWQNTSKWKKTRGQNERNTVSVMSVCFNVNLWSCVLCSGRFEVKRSWCRTGCDDLNHT